MYSFLILSSGKKTGKKDSILLAISQSMVKGGAGVSESFRELLGVADTEAEGIGESSWRLNINEFRLPERNSDNRHKFSFGRLLRSPSTYIFLPNATEELHISLSLLATDAILNFVLSNCLILITKSSFIFC